MKMIIRVSMDRNVHTVAADIAKMRIACGTAIIRYARGEFET